MVLNHRLQIINTNADRNETPDDQKGRQAHGSGRQEHVTGHQDTDTNTDGGFTDTAHFRLNTLSFYVLVRHGKFPPGLLVDGGYCTKNRLSVADIQRILEY
jgi:hypothetical protein